MKLVRLLVSCAIVYAVLLLLVRGILPPESAPTISLLGLPLVVVGAFIARDLTRRSTNPTVQLRNHTVPHIAEDPVRFLSGQIRVASGATDSYFERIVRARLRELLIAKVALEKGIDRDVARRTLSDPKLGQRFLGSVELYDILYGPLPSSRDRNQLIDRAVGMIGAWTG